jgi:hypothetical protein
LLAFASSADRIPFPKFLHIGFSFPKVLEGFIAKQLGLNWYMDDCCSEIVEILMLCRLWLLYTLITLDATFLLWGANATFI